MGAKSMSESQEAGSNDGYGRSRYRLRAHLKRIRRSRVDGGHPDCTGWGDASEGEGEVRVGIPKGDSVHVRLY